MSEVDSTASIAASRQLDDLAPSQLLRYLPDYQVVVCTACQYAVQPHGILRHLKDIHHILRGRRRKYSHYVASLSLRDPKDVLPPNRADQFPVPNLPVEPGLQCLSRGCLYLCASVKRMQSHWRSEHRRRGDDGRDWRPVPIQTFFRGNLLRYFTSQTTSCSIEPSMNTPQFNNLGASLDSMDTALMDYYLRHTYQSFTTNEETDKVWRLIVPCLAQQNSFLLHGLLACTSLHRAYMSPGRPDQEKAFLLRAYRHQDTALSQFRYAIQHPTEDNCNAILAFAYLLVVYSFAADRPECPESVWRTDSLFLVDHSGGEDAEPGSILRSWLYFLRAGCSMLCDVWEQLQESPVRALLEAWDIELGDDPDHSCLKCLLSVIPNESAATGDIGNTSESNSPWTEEVTVIYRQAAFELSRSFAYVRARREFLTTWDILRIWPMKVSLEYMSLLHQGHPGALVLLAHYCILLKQMEKHWYFEGRAASLIRVIQRQLTPGWHSFIQEPLTMVLGLAEEENSHRGDRSSQASVLSGYAMPDLPDLTFWS
ncbi:hypothetical protein BO94DRAFT_530288 [Aspergillus sclerotioniger CBS 115572]|uniref:C2H2-type domain-containing protein n=1 Tax=Aspergillus sclerotioniger CBS 115572 TaxID=1450535 RepID=A0A317XAE5_9EURO|nr:hypothetical protein BO94DRAFT_530288 [Aspergillus sclerotioniger CBS 115572]PWY95554.1 hypothetical protein BO94DRAFT_530288 [Aspergillus sclerotioniger CBS 115572]